MERKYKIGLMVRNSHGKWQLEKPNLFQISGFCCNGDERQADAAFIPLLSAFIIQFEDGFNTFQNFPAKCGATN